MACHPHPLPSAPLSALLAAHSGSAAIPSFYGRLFEKPISFGTIFLGGGGGTNKVLFLSFGGDYGPSGRASPLSLLGTFEGIGGQVTGTYFLGFKGTSRFHCLNGTFPPHFCKS